MTLLLPLMVHSALIAVVVVAVLMVGDVVVEEEDHVLLAKSEVSLAMTAYDASIALPNPSKDLKPKHNLPLPIPRLNLNFPQPLTLQCNRPFPTNKQPPYTKSFCCS